MIHDVQLPVGDRATYVLYLRERERASEQWWEEEREERKWMMGVSLGKPRFFQLSTDVAPPAPIPQPPSLLSPITPPTAPDL